MAARMSRVLRKGLHWLAIGLNVAGLVLIVNMLGLASVGVSILDHLGTGSRVAIGIVFILSMPISLAALLLSRPR